MIFKRKVYDKLLEWKEKNSKEHAVMLEGARRVGKSTIAKEFAKNNYRSFMVIDFSNVKKDVLSCFDYISDLDLFFLRLQTALDVVLYKGESLIIFDEVQLFPKARQAIKHLVLDGRYSYLETGSLISINKNVKDIVIPSEEERIEVYPMDYEEFMQACGKDTYDVLRELYKTGKAVGEALNRKLMLDYRLYMAVGGMPQAVEAYINGKEFDEIDSIKRRIIELYLEDFKKIDPSGKISSYYESIPSQLSLNKKRFVISNVLNKRTTSKDRSLIYDLLDSKTVIACYEVSNPTIFLSQYKDYDSFKLYYSDIGLFTTALFNDKTKLNKDIYKKLLSDKLDANLGYLYECAVAVSLKSSGYDLYYYTWANKNTQKHYEIDFLINFKSKLLPIEVKSGSIKSHSSISEFCRIYSKDISKQVLLSQKDVSHDDMLEIKPIYFTSFVADENIQ